VKPEISIVTSVHNGAEYFDRVVPSILNQSFKDFEWLIINDGSTDHTNVLLAELEQKDCRVKVLSPGRVGFVSALNLGIQSAQGKYIARQDFDDISYPERLQLQIDYLKKYPEVGVVGCNYIVEDQNRQERYIRKPPTQHKQISYLMAKCVPFAHTLVMFRKDAWMQAGGYPDIDDIEDLRLWITFAKLGWELSSIDTALGVHWVHPKSFWHSRFDYATRQRKLANVQMQAVHDLNLPLWMMIYPLGRYIYHLFPIGVKTFLRRVLAGSQETDITTLDSKKND
jgi:glycosyltransferase EpsE